MLRIAPLTAHRLLLGARVAVILLAACVGWAFLWPDTTCSDPVCARERFSLFVELDALQNAGDVPLELESEERRVSVRSVLSAVGVNVTVKRDQTDLPYDPASGPLDRADLFQLFQTWNQLPKPANADAKIYALLTTALVADTGEDLFGLMFDYSGRQGFAVAPAATRALFYTQHPSLIPQLQLRTFTHELLHTLNRHHLDAARTPDGRLTLEAPTKCLADTSNASWVLREKLSWDVSPSTVRFFQNAPPEEVLPGNTNAPFRFAQASPRECEHARENLVQSPAGSRWALARNRLQRLLTLQNAQAAPVSAPAESAQIDLRVQAQSADYPLGYPIAVRIMATNRADHALPLAGRLSPSFGLVRLETRAAGTEEWQMFRPNTRFEPADDEDAMVEPGESTEQTAAVFFGEDGWTFPDSGVYELRARFTFGDMADEVTSPPITIHVTRPDTQRDRRALALLLNDEKQLDAELGRLAAFGGRIGERNTLAPFEELVSAFGDTALGSASRLAVASHRLRPPLDVATGKRAPADIGAARRILADTCTDSGVAALKRELLGRHEGSIDDSMDGDLRRPAYAAWDGVAAEADEHVLTYADADLQPVSVTLHFCFAARELEDGTKREARQLARLIRRAKPEKVVVVGHTDAPASCRYNDRLALDRARAVSDLLIRAGVKRDSIDLVSLGERRPVSFAASPVAHAINRRVEILLPFASLESVPDLDAEEISRVLPACEEPEEIWELADPD